MTSAIEHTVVNQAWSIRQGNALERLREMPDESVHCVVTSPPYYGLRDYGLSGQVWGGESYCEHEWSQERYQRRANDSKPGAKQSTNNGSVGREEPIDHSFCTRCGAWFGTLGLEPTLDLYVQHIVEVFREVWRVLRKDGVVFLNLGDAYWGSWGNYGGQGGANGQRNKETERFDRPAYADNGRRPPQSYSNSSLKPKDLMGIPWRVAFALQADGWWLRSDIVWAKPNPMPESVRDRPTRAHEYVFLLSKSARYYWDADAIREPSITGDMRRPYGSKGSWEMDGRPASQQHGGQLRNGAKVDKQRGHSRRHDGFNDRWDAMTVEQQQAMGANKRTVWSIATQGFPGAHFATFPEKLVEPCILAGTSERGVCGVTGDPWERVTERNDTPHDGNTESQYKTGSAANRLALARQAARERGEEYVQRVTTTGWQPTCGAPWERCGERSTEYDHVTTDPGKSKDGPYASQTGNGSGTHDIRHGVYSRSETTGWRPTCDHDAEPVPATVLDPFCGSGTTGVVALRMGARSLGSS